MDSPTLITLSVLQPPPPLADASTRCDKTKCVKKPRRSSGKSRLVYDFSVETLLQFAHLRQDDAAKALGVAPITLKRICHRRQMRWPYRARRQKELREATAAAAAQAMLKMKMKAVSEDEEEEELRPGRLPSYCVYTMPADVPPIQVKKEPVSPQRLSLPSLRDTLGCRTRSLCTRTLFAPTGPAVDQPVTEPAPSFSGLPRLNVQHASIYQSPAPESELTKKATVEPVLSPAMLRFQALPKTESVARMIDPRMSW